MNNEMLLNTREEKLNVVMNLMTTAARKPLAALSRYYSRILERPINMRQSLLMVNAQAAFIMTVFTQCSLVLRVLFLCWLICAVLKCKSAL